MSRDFETAAATAALRRTDDDASATSAGMIGAVSADVGVFADAVCVLSAAVDDGTSADVKDAVSADVGVIDDVDDAVADTVCALSGVEGGGTAMTSTRTSSLTGREDAGTGVVVNCRRDRGFIDIPRTDSVG